jgi:DNA-binding response OmpR family regulator
MVDAAPVVLVVEDESLLRTMLKELLEAEGYTVEAAADGAEGLARVEAGGIDLVLLDLMMPGMNGLELCRRVREHEGEAYLPIIMVTGLADEVDRHAGFAAGASDYVIKPYKPVDLLDRVRVWVRTRQCLQAARERQPLGQQATPVAGPESVLALACATTHELTRLLSLLLVLAELWDAGYYSLEDVSRIRVELRTAADELAERINTLTAQARQVQQELTGTSTASS